MRILGIDPGDTVGWCLYDALEARVVASGMFAHALYPTPMDLPQVQADALVIEEPVGFRGCPPAMVDCGFAAGRLYEVFARLVDRTPALLTRMAVRKALTAMTLGTIVARNDATVWACLLAIHGGESAAKKGGPIYGVRSHARAALAVAVAYADTRGTHDDNTERTKARPARKAPEREVQERPRPHRPGRALAQRHV